MAGPHSTLNHYSQPKATPNHQQIKIVQFVHSQRQDNPHPHCNPLGRLKGGLPSGDEAVFQRQTLVTQGPALSDEDSGHQALHSALHADVLTVPAAEPVRYGAVHQHLLSVRERCCAALNDVNSALNHRGD